jgi:hypothetical protein
MQTRPWKRIKGSQVDPVRANDQAFGGYSLSHKGALRILRGAENEICEIDLLQNAVTEGRTRNAVRNPEVFRLFGEDLLLKAGMLFAHVTDDLATGAFCLPAGLPPDAVHEMQCVALVHHHSRPGREQIIMYEIRAFSGNAQPVSALAVQFRRPNSSHSAGRQAIEAALPPQSVKRAAHSSKPGLFVHHTRTGNVMSQKFLLLEGHGSVVVMKYIGDEFDSGHRKSSSCWKPKHGAANIMSSTYRYDQRYILSCTLR